MSGSLRRRVLIVDDDTVLLQALSELLREDYETTTCGSAEDALETLRSSTFHLMLCDLQLPGRNGISLVKAVREACPQTAIVLITGHGSVRAAVTALKRGADEFMSKPVKPRRLLALCQTLTSDLPEWLPNKLLADDKSEVVRFDGMIARSASMLAVFDRIRLAAQTDTTVLIVGESGTGKELVAQSIHRRSARAQKPFVPVHTGALPPELIASELFGHERGAFTGAVDKSAGKFELAETGTLFLDEISTMDERTQVNLLRVLETFRYSRVGGGKERTADVRVVAASNRNLDEMVSGDEFRHDLLYRLNVFTIRLPPLRERREDIPVLASAILDDIAHRYQRPAPALPPETQRLLSEYAWPGNVRELRNVIEQSLLLCRGPALEPQLLPQMLHREPPREELIKIAVGTRMDDVEREVILRTLRANGGNKTATAEALGISRRSIYNKLAEYGLGDGSGASPEA